MKCEQSILALSAEESASPEPAGPARGESMEIDMVSQDLMRMDSALIPEEDDAMEYSQTRTLADERSGT